MTRNIEAGKEKDMHQYQAPATLNQAAPVQNTWYTVLAAKKNVRIYKLAIQVDTTDETLEMKITIDGQTISLTALAATAGTAYTPVLAGGIATSAYLVHNTNAPACAFVIEGRSVKVEARKTTAAGAGNLKATVVYGKK